MGLLRELKIMWKVPSSVCTYSRPVCEVLIITFYYENKSSEERAPLLSCKEASHTEKYYINARWED